MPAEQEAQEQDDGQAQRQRQGTEKQQIGAAEAKETIGKEITKIFQGDEPAVKSTARDGIAKGQQERKKMAEKDAGNQDPAGQGCSPETEGALFHGELFSKRLIQTLLHGLGIGFRRDLSGEHGIPELQPVRKRQMGQDRCDFHTRETLRKTGGGEIHGRD